MKKRDVFRNIKLYTLIICLMIIAGVYVTSTQNAYASDGNTFIENTYGLRDLLMDSISNDTIRYKYFQIANEIDHCDRLRCKWYASADFTIGNESYIILLQDYYNTRNFYLSRTPTSDAYPEILKICTASLAMETYQRFEIDAARNTITLIYYINNDLGNDGTFILNDQNDEHLYRIQKDIYQLSEEFKLLESTETQSVLPINEAFIVI